jgi:hypothetical protein
MNENTDSNRHAGDVENPPDPPSEETEKPAESAKAGFALTEPLITADADPGKALGNFFASLDKTIKAIKLYRGEGTVVEKMYEDLANKADATVTRGAITMRVAPFGIVYEGQAVTPHEPRISYLFQLYCDGVRELTLLPGLDPIELEDLIEVFIQESAHKSDKGDDEDLVTLLWKRNLKYIRYYAVDSLATATGSTTSRSSLAQDDANQRLDQGKQGELELALTSDDIRVLRTEDLLEWVREATSPIKPLATEAALAKSLADAYRREPEYGRFMLIATRATTGSDGGDSPASPLVLGVFDSLVNRADLEGVTAMLNHMASAKEPLPPGLAKLKAALVSPQRLPMLAHLYTTETDRISECLESFVDEAHEGLVALLTALDPGDAETRLQQTLNDAGVDLTPFFTKRLRSEKEVEVLGAVAALGRIGTPAAIRALSTALSSNLAAVRKGTLEAMQDHYDESARVALRRVLRDPDKENRLMALKIFANSGDQRVCWALVSTAQDPSFLNMDQDEQVAFYDAIAGKRNIGRLPEQVAPAQVGEAGHHVDAERVEKCTVSEDRTESQIHEITTQILNVIYSMTRALVLYDPNNAAVARLVDALLESVQEYFKLTSDGLKLQLLSDEVFVNGRLLKVDPLTYDKLSDLASKLAPFELGKFQFTDGLTKEQIERFCGDFANSLRTGTKKLSAEGYGSIKVGKSEGSSIASFRFEPDRLAGLWRHLPAAHHCPRSVPEANPRPPASGSHGQPPGLRYLPGPAQLRAHDSGACGHIGRSHHLHQPR